jgi:hypothetical protein
MDTDESRSKRPWQTGTGTLDNPEILEQDEHRSPETTDQCWKLNLVIRVLIFLILLLVAARWAGAQNCRVYGTFMLPNGQPPSTGTQIGTVNGVAVYGKVTFSLIRSMTRSGTTYEPVPIIGWIRGDGGLIDSTATLGVVLTPTIGSVPANVTYTAEKILQGAKSSEQISVPDQATANYPDLVIASPLPPIYAYMFSILSTDPSAPANGTCWYNISNNLFRCRENSITKTMIGGAGGGATFQIDGVNLLDQTLINWQDTTELDWTNPSLGNVQLALKSASVADSKLAPISNRGKLPSPVAYEDEANSFVLNQTFCRLGNIRFADCPTFQSGSSTGGIQEAIADLPSSGGIIFISAGTYSLTALPSSFTKPVFFKGAGRDVTTLKIGNGANLTGTMLHALHNPGPVWFEDLTLDGNKANQTSGAVSGIVSQGTAATVGVYLKRVAVKNFAGTGFGAGIGWSGGATEREIRVSDSTFDNNADRHIQLGQVAGASIRDSRIITPSGNPSVEITTLGGNITALSDVMIDNLRVDGATPSLQNIVKIQGDSDETLSDIRIVNSIFAMTGSGDVIAVSGTPTVTHLVIKGNQVVASSDGGIVVTSGDHVTVVGNTVRGCNTSAIVLSGTRQFSVTGNIIQNDTQTTSGGIVVNATARTPDYGVIEGNYIRAGSASAALNIASPLTAYSIKVGINAISQGSITLAANVDYAYPWDGYFNIPLGYRIAGVALNFSHLAGTLGASQMFDSATANLPLLSGGAGADPAYAELPFASITSYPTGCTNQFVRALGDSLTCNSVAAADLASAFLNATSDLDNGLCTDGQILKKVSGAWACAADDTGAGGGYATIQEEGTGLTQRNTLNFIGPAVTAADDAGNTRTNVTVVASGTGACPANQWASTLNNGAAPTCTQPAFSNVSGTATDSQLASNYSGVGSCTNQFVRSLNDNAAPTCATVGAADLASAFLNAVGDLDNGLCSDGQILKKVTGAWACAAETGGGANTALSNLASVAVNTSILPGTDASIDLGSAAKQWRDVYFSGSLIAGGTGPPSLEGTPGSCTVSGAGLGKFCLDSTGNRFRYSYNGGAYSNHALASDKLSAFAATTSAELAGVISDETGSGGLNFGARSGTGACTSQFVRGLNDNAAPTCATVGAADLASAFLNATSDLDNGLCTDGQILKKVSGAWACAADDTGAGGGYATIQEEGSPLTQRNTFNFIGPAVTAADDAGNTRTNVTVVASGTGTCTNQFPRTLNNGAAPTCESIADGDIPAAITRDSESPAAGDISGSHSAGYQIDSGAVGTAEVATVLKTKAFAFILGADNGSVLADTDDQDSIFINYHGQSVTLEEIYCECDAGSPTVNFQRDDGTPADILTSNLTAANTGACARAAAEASTINSAVTCVATLSATEKILAAGNRVDWKTISAGGTAKRITCWGKYPL